MSMKRDLGTVMTLSGTAIHTSYTASTAFNGGKADNLRFTFILTTIALTNITSYTCKVSESYDGVVYEDVKSLTDLGGTPAVENAFSLGAAATAQSNHLTVSGEAKFYKVSIKVAGGAGQALESIVCYAQAF